MVPAPAGAYQLTTGTSVAAAHVSGVAALLLEKHPQADAQLILEVLTASATRLGANKRDDKLGWGLVDPLAALSELDARLADTKVASTTPARRPRPPPGRPATPARAPTERCPPRRLPATTRSTLPRPGIYVPEAIAPNPVELRARFRCASVDHASNRALLKPKSHSTVFSQHARTQASQAERSRQRP